MTAEFDWKEAHENKPTKESCDKVITVDVVGTRCIYLNDHRIAGGKPYVSEGLPSRSKKLTVRGALDAFSVAELTDYLAEKQERSDYFAKCRAECDAIKAASPRS